MSHPDSSTNADTPDNKIMDQETEASETNARSSNGFQVGASPFNSVKLELAIAIILVVLLWMVLETVTSNVLVQLGVLLFFSCIAALWLIIRTRRLTKLPRE